MTVTALSSTGLGNFVNKLRKYKPPGKDNDDLTKQVIEEAERVKLDVSEGHTKLLYVAPESLTKPETIDFLRSVGISFVAVDEAHCISEWGHDFRPEYRRIKPIVKDIADVPIMALTFSIDCVKGE